MRIALCDDEARENEHLAALIDAYARKMNYDIHCEAFTDGKTLLQQPKFDLYFLDFKMDGMDGIAVANALKEKFNQAVTICYLTNYESAAAEIINHRIYADGFLKKPVEGKLLEEKIDQFYRLSFFTRYELKKGGTYQTVYAQDILYAEADGKKTKIHFFDRTETFNYLLSEMEEMLGTGGLFCRIHRSFLVNLMHVEKYDSRCVTLKNGVVLPLKTRGFKEQYQSFIFMLNR